LDSKITIPLVIKAEAHDRLIKRSKRKKIRRKRRDEENRAIPCENDLFSGHWHGYYDSKFLRNHRFREIKNIIFARYRLFFERYGLKVAFTRRRL
jgi:hypothetical protein